MNTEVTTTGHAVAQVRHGDKPSFRLSDISKIIRGRYNGPCLTADAERYLTAAIPEMMRTARSWRYAVAWAREWTPDLLDTRGEEFIKAAWAKIAARKRRHLTTDQLSRLLKVADDEPVRLGLRCIPAASRNAETRKIERRAKNAKDEAARRLRKKPDITPRSESLTAKAPWKAAGMGKTKWYEMRKAEALVDAVEPQETADPNSFVDTVSVAASEQFRGHRILYTSLPDQSGQEVSGTEGANDNLRAPHHRKVAGNPLKDRADALRQSMTAAA